MSYQPNISTPVTYDASNRLRVGQLTTLFDGKVLNTDDPLLWETVGTGISSFTTNQMQLSVTSGQYLIRKSRRYSPYFSGKSQMIEITCDNFHTQSNVVKRAGYFSSNAVAPYDTTYDGIWLENDGTTIRLKTARLGTETLNVPITSWNGYSKVSSYDFSKFTVFALDFLWLGGANLRLFMRTANGLELLHTFNYPGTSANTFISSPNQPIRYEIRSTTGTGTMNAICSQVSTEGSIDEGGKNRAIDMGTAATTLTTIGTAYALLGVRLQTTQRNKSVKVIGMQAFTNTNDVMKVSLILNPTITGAATWADVTNSAFQRGVPSGVGGTAASTISGGTEIMSFVTTQNSVIPPNILSQDYLSSLGITLANVSDELWLVGTPYTAGIPTYGVLNLKEY